MIRVPLRPLARVIAARNQGLDPDVMDAERRAAALRLRKTQERKRAERRLWLLSAVFVMGFGAVAGKMAIVSASEPVETARGAASEPLRAHRADIVDRNGELLATNIVTAALYVETRHMVDPLGVAEGLAGIFPDLEVDALTELFARPGNFHWIKQRISPEQRQAVHDLGQPGVFFGPRETRIYPQGQRLGHILGGSRFEEEATRAAETAGVAGVELMFNERLGDPDQLDAPLRLSIDLRAQNAMRDVLAAQMERFDAIGATGILMRADNGEIVSMVSLPDFDPNDRPPPVGPGSDRLFSRASQGVYELGSTFKTLTVAQSLELGLVNPETVIDTRGPLQWGRFRIRDFHNYGPELTVNEVMEHSSNIGTARIALEIGITRHQDFLRELGFFEPVEVELPESRSARPLLPPRWSDLSTMTISYGHGLAATPLHLASAYATIANGGLRVTPTLLAGAPAPTEADRVISERTSGMVNRMLRNVVAEGTAGFADVEGYEVGGKTGTADKPSAGGYAEDRVIATFAAVFPASDPEYVLVVTLDEPEDRSGPVVRRTAGWTAAPTAGMIIRRVAPVLGMQPARPRPETFIDGMALAGGRG